MKILKKAAAILISCAMLAAATTPLTAFAESAQQNRKEAMELKFNENGEFKILAIADTQDTDKPQKEMLDILNNTLDEVKPDLVVFLGDNTAGWWKGVTKEKTATAIRKLIEPVDKRNVPFAIVYGNHDHEGLCHKSNGMTEEDAKEFMLSVYQEFPTCLAIEGEEMTGCGTYNLLIKDHTGTKDIFNLWMMDSNPYYENGYGFVQPDQRDWYIKTSNELKAANGGTPLPSLLFQHIAVPEVYQLADSSNSGKDGYVHGNTAMFRDKYWKASSNILQGAFEEGPCPADVEHDQFETWKNQGDVIGAFFGHDHPNDYLGELDGIKLCAVPAAGYYSYGWNHGARTITLHENDLTDFETEILKADDILGYEVKPDYKDKHGYYEYKTKFLPGIIGSTAGAAILAAAVTGIRLFIKKKKSK